MLPTNPKERKRIPVTLGVLAYFPRSIAALAALAREGNERHNPGEPLHWARAKSTDHLDCLGRHTLDALADVRHVQRDGYVVTLAMGREESGMLHAVEMAWRALAHLEECLDVRELGEGPGHEEPTPEEPTETALDIMRRTPPKCGVCGAPCGPRVRLAYGVKCCSTACASRAYHYSTDESRDVAPPEEPTAVEHPIPEEIPSPGVVPRCTQCGSKNPTMCGC